MNMERREGVKDGGRGEERGRERGRKRGAGRRRNVVKMHEE